MRCTTFLEQIRALVECGKIFHRQSKRDLVNREYSIVVVCIAESNPLLNSVGYHYPGKGTTRSRSQSLKTPISLVPAGHFPELLPNHMRTQDFPAGFLLICTSSSHLIHCHTVLVALAEHRCTPAGTCSGRTQLPGDSRLVEPAARAGRRASRGQSRRDREVPAPECRDHEARLGAALAV